MKKTRTIVSLLIRGIVFLLIFGYLLMHFSYMKRPDLTHTRNNISGFYNEPENTLDLVFIGTSGTMSAFAPMQAWISCGYTSYNFATNEMSVEAQNFAIGEVLKTQTPKAIVIDVRPYIRKDSLKRSAAEGNDSSIRYNTDGYRYSWDRFRLIWDNIPHTYDSLSYYFDIIKYHGNKWTPKNWDCAYHMSLHGFNQMGWGNEIYDPYVAEEAVPLDADLDAALDELIETCKNVPEPTQILFIYYPYGLAQSDDRSMERVAYIQQRVEAEGLEFLNCEENFDEYGFDPGRDWWNNGHWNIFGAEKITNILAPYFRDKYGLENKRIQPGYEQWNADIETWMDSCQSQKAKLNDVIAQTTPTESEPGEA